MTSLKFHSPFSHMNEAVNGFNSSLFHLESQFFSSSLIVNLDNNNCLNMFIPLQCCLHNRMHKHTTHTFSRCKGGFKGQSWAKVHCVLARKSYDSSAPFHQPNCQVTWHHLSAKASQLNTQRHGWANHHYGYTTLLLMHQSNDWRIGYKLS